jgi:hypothetical protein
LIGIPQAETHLFQIFAVVTCDYLWFISDKAHHDGLIPNALVILFTINKTVLEHHSTWKTKLAISCEVWQYPSPPFFKINYDTIIRDTFFCSSCSMQRFQWFYYQVSLSSVILAPHLWRGSCNSLGSSTGDLWAFLILF